MSKKLSKIRLLRINERVIIGNLGSTIPELKKFFEEKDGSEIIELHILLMEERARGTDLTWAQTVAKAKFNLEDLPVFL